MAKTFPPRYRKLRFESLDDVAAEVRRLHEQGWEALGQWSLGQACHHLSFVMRSSLDGFPPDVRGPRWLRWIVSATVPVWINRPIPPGIPLRGGLTALQPPDRIDEDAAVAECLALIERLKAEPQRHPSPVAGRLSRSRWDLLHRNHAAHHLGFLVPRA